MKHEDAERLLETYQTELEKVKHQIREGTFFGKAIAPPIMNGIVNRAFVAGATAVLRTPTPELKGALPLVLYFANEKDRDDLIAAALAVIPNLKTQKL